LSVRRGSLTRLSRAVAFQRRPLSTLIEAQASAGDMFPVTLLVGGRMWVLAAPELAHQVLHGPPALYRAGRANRRILPVLPSDTVLPLDGDDHRARRRVLAPLFRGDSLAAMAPIIRDIAAAEVARWPIGVPFAVLPTRSSRRPSRTGADATGIPESCGLEGVEERRCEVAGISNRWLERAGGGLPVTLVHGIPTSPELWRHVIPRLEGPRLLAWEMPGYGRSWQVAADPDISVAAQADRLLAWLDELGIERTLLVGHDLGGGVVQIPATRAPERCAGRVLTNAIAYDSWPIPEVKAMRTAAPLLTRLPRPLFRAQFPLLIRQGHGDLRRARVDCPSLEGV